MCGGGGAGGSGTQRYDWNDNIAPYWQQALGQANYLTGLGLNGSEARPYQRYTGQRIADLTDDHYNAMQNVRNIASAGPFNNESSADTNMARTQNYMTSRGDYLGRNPHATTKNEYGSAMNPWQDASANLIENKYKGDNPYFRGVVQSGLQDLAQGYTAATDTNLQRFKGSNRNSSAFDQANGRAEQNLAREQSRFINEMSNQQYDRSANLEEAHIGRDLQDQQFDKDRGGSWYQDMLGRQFAGEENRLNRGTNTWEGERGRMLQGSQLGMAGQGMDFDRYRQMMGIGDMNRGLMQDHLNLGLQDWQEEQQHPFRMLDLMTGIMSRAQGGVAPNASFTTPGYSASPMSQLMGAGLLGYGMFGR